MRASIKRCTAKRPTRQQAGRRNESKRRVRWVRRVPGGHWRMPSSFRLEPTKLTSVSSFLGPVEPVGPVVLVVRQASFLVLVLVRELRHELMQEEPDVRDESDRL